MDAFSQTDRIARAPLSPTEGGAPLYDVAIIGGGASGLTAAITAAQAGARCCVIERDVEAGLGLLATGNGRCNISNAQLHPRHFQHPDAIRHLFNEHAERDISSFFRTLGLLFAEEGEGRLYPITRRAESVRDVLLNACDRLGVDLICCADVSHAAKATTWELTLNTPAMPLSFKRGRDAKAHIRNARKALALADRRAHAVRARSVIIASGGRSKATCELFALNHLEETPVLCPIACTLEHAGRHDGAGASLEQLDGLRVEGTLALIRHGAAIAFEQGEVLFRPYGISGIAALNLSRRLDPGDTIELDLFPTLRESELSSLLQERARCIGPFDGNPLWFDGILARPLSRAICPMLAREREPLQRAASLLRHMRFDVQGTTEHAQAHVHRGGIPLDDVDLDTCAILHLHNGEPTHGLYGCGEALDMDADCGGYNLAWAWMSGMRAGACAAKGAAC